MCTAKPRLAECGHTISYEIMLPCPSYPGSGPPCPAWNARLLNKVMTNRPSCVDCHLQQERKIARRYIEAEMGLARGGGDGTTAAKGVWEARLRSGVKMQAEVNRLDKKAGREGAWREEERL